MQLWAAAIGETNAGLVGRISARAARVLRVPVEVAADPLPASAYSRQRRQYLAGTLIQEAARSRRPPDTHLLAVTEADLYAPQLNFVFGQADPGLGVALISLARLREEFLGQAADPDLLLE